MKLTLKTLIVAAACLAPTIVPAGVAKPQKLTFETQPSIQNKSYNRLLLRVQGTTPADSPEYQQCIQQCDADFQRDVHACYAENPYEPDAIFLCNVGYQAINDQCKADCESLRPR